MSILLGHKNKKEILKHRKLLAPFVHGNMPALQGPAENTMRIQEQIITWLPYQSQVTTVTPVLWQMAQVYFQYRADIIHMT